MGDGWELLKIRGIPLRVHPSWFVILTITTVMFQAQVAADVGTDLAVAITWCAGFLTALLLFVSVLLHELGHSLVALREGVKVRSITLFLMHQPHRFKDAIEHLTVINPHHIITPWNTNLLQNVSKHHANLCICRHICCSNGIRITLVKLTIPTRTRLFVTPDRPH